MNLEKLEDYLRKARWNFSGEYQNIIVFENNKDTFTLADNNGIYEPIRIEYIDELLADIELVDNERSLEKFWSNYQHCPKTKL